MTWIIGASSGIGAALARAWHARGERLILSARREQELQDLNTELGAVHLVMPLDVLDARALSSAVEALRVQGIPLGRVVLLAADYVPMTLGNMDLAAAQRIVDVNLKGTLNVLHVLLPLLREQGGGQLVLCGSVAGYRGLPGGQPYCATKAAIASLAESLRVEEATTGIDVRLLCPGFVRTRLTERNHFPMPLRMEVDDAAAAVLRGLAGRRFEIHFPWRFTWLMKALRWLPDALFFRLAGRFKP